MSLREDLKRYADKGMVSFHMPGHKGSLDPLDVTELPGLDDLYAPSGMIKEALERAAAFYGSDKCFYLVNGSTVGVLTAISAAVKKGGHMIMQRASHKSAYHAAVLRDLKLTYIYEECDDICGAGCGVSLSAVKQAVEADPSAEAVFITSPSYEGFVSDVTGIAAYLHSAGKKLIVDAAHGAHFAMSDKFPLCAAAAGADMVVMSLHKTLPCPNQAALLHIKGGRVSAERVNSFLAMYQTSSPSYPLMADMDECINSSYDWEGFISRRRKLSESLSSLKNITLRDAYDGVTGASPEPCKMLLCPKDGCSGIKLHEALRERGIEPEMSLPGYVLLICSVADTDEDYEKLVIAVRDIDESWQPEERSFASLRMTSSSTQDDRRSNAQDDKAEGVLNDSHIIRCVKDASEPMNIADAWESEYEDISLAAAEGRISAVSVMAYPPGRPILVPGEQITEGIIKEILSLLRSGCVVKGIYKG